MAKIYSDYKKNKKTFCLTPDELNLVEWTKYKIVVPSKEDKDEIMSGLKHFHDCPFDSDIIVCNQLAHSYVGGDNIIVDEALFNKLNQE